jgi:hypothetical protein
MRPKLIGVLALVLLGACSTAQPTWAPDAAVTAARFVSTEPASITLFTVVNNHNGSGAHSGLLINASQRVMFDPAGSWGLPRLAERNDVHFGMTDQMIAFYIDYHARETFRVIEQKIIVSPEVAELVMQRVMDYGAVPKAHCANSITDVLGEVPGFESVGRTWFPNKLSKAFDELPGVTSRVITDDDADKNYGVLIVQQKSTTTAP